MATNTGGGTTASLSNTPQANDDSFVLPEDYNSIKWLDVTANDLGGNAKILWSLDDSATDAMGANDLISTDVGKLEASTNDTSLQGAKIWIQDGKVGYDAYYLNSTFRAQLQALAVNETLTDSFTYAIRMSNGTLSWGTATIVFTGTNDGPDISVQTGDSTSTTLTETNSDLSTNGTLTVVDPDTTDTVTMSISGFSKSGNAGTLSDSTLQAMFHLTESSLAANAGDSHNLHWSFGSTPTTFDYLADGESLTLNYTVKADDGHGGVDTQTVTIVINGTNDGPTIAGGAILNGAVKEDSGTYSTNGSFGFGDLDSSDHHSVSYTSGGSGYLGAFTPSVSDDSTDDGAGTVSWTFNVNNADLQFLAKDETRTQTYTITLSDGHGGSATQTVTVVLSGCEDPIVITSGPQSLPISEDGTNVGGSITFNDVDLSDTHTASAAAHAGNLTSLGTFGIDPSVAEAANASNGSIGWSYTVNNAAAQYLAVGETAVEKYDVTFNDGHGSVVTEVVTVTITGSNDGPDIRAIAGDDAGHNLNEGDAGLSTSGTLTVTDPDNSDVVDTSVTHLAVSGNHPGLSESDLLAMFHITAGGSGLAANAGDSHNLSWSFDSSSQAFNYLAEGETLTLTYTLTSSDGHGGTDSQDVVVVITGTNDAPVTAADTNAGNEDTTISGSVTGNDDDVDSDDSAASLTYALTGPAPAGLTFNGDGSYSLDASNAAYQHLAEGETTDVVVSYTATDSHGAVSNVSTLTITVTGVNDAPVANNDSVSTAEDTPVNFDVRTNDSDVDGDSLTVTKINGTSISVGSPVAITGGSISLLADGTLTYTPTPNFNGNPPSFSYTVSDGHGGTVTANVSLSVSPVNDNPVANTDGYSVNEDNALIVPAVTGVLANDTDVDGNPLTAVLVSGPAHGTLTLNPNGSFTYTPDLNFNGTDSFTYKANDGSADSAAATVNLTVNAVNDAPVNTVPGTQTIAEDGTRTFSTANGNAISVSDVDVGSGNLTVTLSVAHGTLTLGTLAGLAFGAGDGTADATMTFTGTQAAVNAALQGLVYSPTADFNGSDTVTITTSDNGNSGSGGTLQDSDTAMVNITAVADIVADNVTVNQNSGANSLNLLANDTFENPGRFISAVGSASHGTVSINNNGTPGVLTDDFVVYTPTAGYSGSDSFTYTVTSGGVTETAAVNVTVQSSDSLAPTDIVFNLNPASGGFSGNNGLGSGDLLGSFTAVDADSTTWTFAIGGPNASLFTLSPTGSQSSVSITAASNVPAGDYTFTITATDPAGHSSTPETFHVFVGTTGGDTTVVVSTGTDIDFGLNGQDVINGGAGDDALVGGQNADQITGGAGADQLIGGQGADAFIYAATSDSTAPSHDTIFDFDETVNGEQIDLHLIDANTALSGDQAFAFQLAQTQSVVNNTVTWYQDATHNQTIIQADNNGDGVADLVIYLTGIHNLTGAGGGSDFIL